MGLNYVLEGFNLQQILHDSKLSVPLSLSIIFVNREVFLSYRRGHRKGQGTAIGML